MMDNIQQSNAFTFGEFNWWIGKVVSNEDTKKLGRVKVASMAITMTTSKMKACHGLSRYNPSHLQPWAG